MKKLFVFLAAIGLLFACTPKENPSNGGNNNDKGGNTQPTVVELTGIALTEHEITLEKGGNKILEVKFTPENATNKTLTWVSSNPSIVTVTDGIVVGVAPGSTEIIVKSDNLTDKCQVTVVISAASVSLDQTEITLAPGGRATLKATVLPEDTTDELEWTSSDEAIATVKDGEVSAVAEGDAIITAKAGDKTATCSVKVVFIAVDLGLSVKWAECNLGASSPEEYGDYYAWGETEIKTTYNWSTYKFGTSSSGPFSKYNTSSSYGTVDNKTVLDPEDDVANVKLGGNWRMPTDTEWTELRTKCKWTWTTRNGVNGRRVTGPSGNSIFLPTAGYRYDSNLYSVGSYGLYWSSSLLTGLPDYARSVDFDSGDVYRSNYNRYLGLSVRPVTE